MALPPERFTIWAGMIVVAVSAGLAAIAMSCWWILLLVLPPLPLLLQRRAPTTEFLCALIGLALGYLFLPIPLNVRPTFDVRDFAEVFRIIGGAVIGALVGAVIARADRRIAAWAGRVDSG
jgi:hypothetical protein